jgi:hypothetical protein
VITDENDLAGTIHLSTEVRLACIAVEEASTFDGA